jgi:hypothetical protein
VSPVHDREPAVGASRLTVFHELALEKCGDYTILQPTEVTLVFRNGNPHRLTAVTGPKGVDDEARSSAN